MAGLSPAPLPVFGTLFDPAAGFGCGDPAPLPVFGSLFTPVNARSLTADYGSFTLTGKAATLKSGRRITAAYGAFALTGEDATLSYNTPTGGIENAAPLPVFSTLFARADGVYVMFADTGQFTLTGKAASFVKGYVLVADYGSFTASFPDGVCDMQMGASAGAFTLTGEAATLQRGVPAGLVAGTGSFALRGFDATLVYNQAGTYTLACEPGVFTLTGFATADTARDFVLTADYGSFVVTGQAATLVGNTWSPVAQLDTTWTKLAKTSTTWISQ